MEIVFMDTNLQPDLSGALFLFAWDKAWEKKKAGTEGG